MGMAFPGLGEVTGAVNIPVVMCLAALSPLLGSITPLSRRLYPLPSALLHGDLPGEAGLLEITSADPSVY